MEQHKLIELCTAIRTEQNVDKFNDLLGKIGETLEEQKKNAADIYKALITEQAAARSAK